MIMMIITIIAKCKLAKSFGLSTSTVQNIVKRFREYGKLLLDAHDL